MNRLERLVDETDPRLAVRLRLLKKRVGRDPLLAVIDAVVAPGESVIDVGANRGVYTHKLARAVGRSRRVWSIEPFPANAAALRRCGRSAAAIPSSSARSPSRTVTARPSSTSRSTAAARCMRWPRSGRRTVTVPTARLDDVVGDHADDVTFLKIDVEGHEAAVLSGGRRVLSSRPTIVIEIEQRHHNGPIDGVFDELRAVGYEGWFIDTTATPWLRPLDEFDVDVHQHRHVSGTFVSGEMPAGYVFDFVFADPGRVRALQPLLAA